MHVNVLFYPVENECQVKVIREECTNESRPLYIVAFVVVNYYQDK